MARRTNTLLLAALTVVVAGCSDNSPSEGIWDFEDPSEPTTVEDWTEVDRRVETEVEHDTCASRDLAIEVVPVSGAVLAERWGFAFGERGWSVVYTDQMTDARYVFAVSVDDSGVSGSYRGELPAGTYDIALESSDLQGCSFSCVVARRTAVVGPERTFDFDVEFHDVYGEFWLDAGQPGLPTEPSAHLEFRSVETGTVYSSVVSRGAAGGFGVFVPVGEYDVTWVSDGPAEFAELSPIGVGYLGRFDLGSGEYLRLDLTSMTVEGEVTIGGAAMPDDTLLDGEARGMLRFSLRGPHYEVWDVPVGELGRGTFSQRLFPGDYAIEFITNDVSRQGVLVPSVGVSLCGGEVCRVASAGDPWVVDIDSWLTAPVVPVTGRVDLDGDVVDDCSHGDLSFRQLSQTDAPRVQGVTVVDSPTGSHYRPGWSVSLDSDGRFDTRLPQGPYDVTLRRGSWDCAAGAVGATILDSELQIAGRRSDVVYRAETGRIAGELTVNGAAMPDNGASGDMRGVMELRHDGGSVSIPLGNSGPARFDVPLLVGTYDVVIVTEIFGRVPVPYVQDVLPQGERALGTVTVHEGNTTALEVDLDIVSVRDVVRFSGLRDIEGTLDGRGLLVRLVDSTTGLDYDFPTDTSGAFTGPAYPGTYEALLVRAQGVWATVSGPPLVESLISACYVVAP